MVMIVRRVRFLVWFMMAGAGVAWAGQLPDFARIVRENRAAVVNISSTEVMKAAIPGLGVPGHFVNPFFHGPPRGNGSAPRRFAMKSLGSGVIIGANGYILTCAHVINHAKQVIVKLANHRDYVARVIGLDTKSDVALLKIPATHLATVRIGHPSRLQVGDWVLAIGAPFGFENSATAGIVSAVGRNLPGSDYVPFIQTDVPINPGNSGGPLFNTRGQVVGINSQIYSRTGGFMGLSFAIPINLAIRISHDLKVSGHVPWSWLGVTIQNVTRRLAVSFDLRKPYGALISEVLPGSPAARSRLQAGDIIVRYDGHPITRASDLPPLVGFTPAGTPAYLKIIRNGHPETLSVVVGALPEALPAAYTRPPRKPHDNTSLGLALRDLTGHERRALGVTQGVFVEGVSHGPGAKAGIVPGDVILSLAGRPTASVPAFMAILAHVLPQHPVPVLIHRDGRSMFLALSK